MLGAPCQLWGEALFLVWCWSPLDTGRIWWNGAALIYFIFFSWSCSQWALCPPSWGEPGFVVWPYMTATPSRVQLGCPALSSLYFIFLLVQGPEVNTRCGCCIVLYSNVFKCHVLSTIPNGTQCLTAFFWSTTALWADDFRGNSDSAFLQQLELDKVQVLSGSRGIAWNVFPLDAYITSVCWSVICCLLAVCCI